MRNSGIFYFAGVLIVLSLLVFAVLQGFRIPVGNFMDWLIGAATFAWLLTIVTVPWNVYFEAGEVLHQARTSENKNINFDTKQLAYVKTLRFWSLGLAMTLHLVSAVGLYYLAWAKISAVGYYGAGAAILLTFLRPSMRSYEYITKRLAAIRGEILYPRQDLALLKLEWETTQAMVKDLVAMLKDEEGSWYARVESRQGKALQSILNLQGDLAALHMSNEEAHERISKETRQAVAQLTEDGKFIDNLVEIIRFIKKV